MNTTKIERVAREILESVYSNDGFEPDATAAQVVEYWRERVDILGMLWFANEHNYRMKLKGHRDQLSDNYQEIADEMQVIFDREALARAENLTHVR
jgi:hypothetical protein